jgi:F-type H+-transporting ATPase subunit b
MTVQSRLLLAALLTIAAPIALAASAAGQEHQEHEESSDAAHGHHDDLGHGNAGRQLEDPSEFRSDISIYTFVVFLLLLAILSKFAWPPIVRALEAREKYIADQIAAAEARHEDAKKLLAAHEAKLAHAADEVRELLEEARRDAEHTKVQIIAEAKKAAEEERQRAIREVEQAKDAALHELAERSANTAIDLAGRVIREQINPDRQAEIVREALSKLAASKPSAN